MENEIIETDVLIIGGGPAGLSAAIHLADLLANANIPLNAILLEKANAMGNHSLSGAVINPVSLYELLPGIKEKDIPFESPVIKEELLFLTENNNFKFPFIPPYMGNKGNYIASLGRLVRWLSDIAEKKGVQVFPSFCGYELIFENEKVVGVRTGARGLDKRGKPMENYQPPADVRAKIIILAEGTRGNLAKSLIQKLNLAQNRNPHVYSLGVKELWEVPEGRFEAGRIVHTLGYPVGFDQFGGGFIYGLNNNIVALGLAVGLDFKDPTFDPHHAFQIYKKHPFISKIIKDAKIIRYGAKTIPEGGLFSIPKFYHDNVMIVGDSAGFLSMPSLKGVHPAIHSGMLAAKTAFEALKKNNTSAGQMSLYEDLFKKSQIYKDLYAVRNFRQGFKSNLLFGMLNFGMQILTGGRGLSLSGRLKIEEDYLRYRPVNEFKGKTFLEQNKDKLVFDKLTTFDKETSVFYSGTKHAEEQPSHISVPSSSTCQDCIEKYNAPCQRFCPAKVFEIVDEPKTGKKELTLHPGNCVHCKTCDIKDPFCNAIWSPPYGGDGPNYENM